jgi:hypothetical protein
LETSASDWAKVLFGTVSVLAAVLTAVQTFLGLDARSDAFQRASDAYGALFREVEDLKDDVQRGKDIEKQKDDVLGRWNSARALVKKSAPNRYWRRASNQLARRSTNPNREHMNQAPI